MNWLLIALLVIVVFLFLKYRELRHKLSFIVILILFLLLGLSFWNVYSTNHVDLGTFDGVVKAGKLYFSWLGGVLGNAKTLTAYAVKQDWGIGHQELPVTSEITNSSAGSNVTDMPK